MSLRRISALALIVALTLVPAVGRAVQRVDSPNAKPRLSAPYRSVDVRPTPVLIAPDTSARSVVVRTDGGARRNAYRVHEPALPAAPVVSDREALRGPPSLHL